MQKVMIMSSVHPWNDPRIFYRQARSLARRYRVELHAPGPVGRMDEDGVTVVGLPRAARVQRPLQWFRLLLRALRSGADFFHLHDPELLGVGVLVRIITRRPVIYDAHEDFSLVLRHKAWLPAPLRGPVYRVGGWLEKALACRLHAVVAATPDIAENFNRHRFPAVTVCNFPPPQDFSQAGQTRHYRRDGIFTAVYVGGLSAARGILDLLQVLDLLPGMRLVLAGVFFDRDTERAVKARALRNEQLVFLGRLPPDQVPGLLRSADAGLVCLHPLPNHVRSMPLKLFEYMAAGLPVVASDFPLWEEIISGCSCGLTVTPGDPRSIAVALEKLARNPVLRRRLGENGARAWAEKYNWAHEEAKLLGMYARLGGRHDTNCEEDGR